MPYLHDHHRRHEERVRRTIVDSHRHYTHSWIHETLVDLLAIQKEDSFELVLAIMDGTTAGNGPRGRFP